MIRALHTLIDVLAVRDLKIDMMCNVNKTIGLLMVIYLKDRSKIMSKSFLTVKLGLSLLQFVSHFELFRTYVNILVRSFMKCSRPLKKFYLSVSFYDTSL